MNEANSATASNKQEIRGWGNRIQIASLSGILFLTLYPFEFSRHTTLPAGRPPLFLGVTGKGGGTLDVVLNILLFMPFGFGFAVHLHRKGKSWVSALFYAWTAGILLSYCIEFLQIYIPARDSGWQDVFSNSTGSGLGALLFQVIGPAVLRALESLDRAVESSLLARRAFVALILWFLVWGAYSVQLQKDSHLKIWTADNFLVFGNDATGRHPWHGKLFTFQMWDRALDSESSRSLTRSDGNAPTVGTPLVSFDFSAFPPEQSGSLRIPLSSIGLESSHIDRPFAGGPLVASTRPVSDLIADFRRTNQFSVHAIFIPDSLSDTHGRIASFSAPAGIPDFFVGQTNEDLLFWSRNEVSVRHPGLAWNISRVLVANQTSNVLFSFDGSNLRLFSNGRKVQDRYWGPGTALASQIRPVKQGELNGYSYIFYAVLFVPIGCLIAILARSVNWSATKLRTAVLVAFLVLPIALECELALLDHRSFSVRNFCLSLGMALGGFLWTNADRAAVRQLPSD